MKLTRIGLISLSCAGSAVAFGVLAHTAIDLIGPSRSLAAMQPASAEAEPAATAKMFALASTTSVPADITPIKVKTVPIIYQERAAAAPERVAAVPLPRPRPASAPVVAGSIAYQPASIAISSATRAAVPPADDPLSPANIDEMKTALALTAEQEEFWPAVAAELRAIGKQLPRGNARRGQAAKVNLDTEAMQRLYMVAAPLLTRLSYDQKIAVKQMARNMGLVEVAEAL
jgi:hypothetical protein